MTLQQERHNIHRQAWLRKKILREVYREWHHMICFDLAPLPGPNIEVGAGIGNFKNFRPDFIASDILRISGLDLCLDALHLPFARQSVANIVMIDVLHHLNDPLKFLQQAADILKPGGRIILMEPYITPFSHLIYLLFHRESITWGADYFGINIDQTEDPWQGNLAMINLLFKQQGQKFFQRLDGTMMLVKKELLSFLMYPLSGGFEGPSLLPDIMLPVIRRVERFLKPIHFLMAFRCYLVLERGKPLSRTM